MTGQRPIEPPTWDEPLVGEPGVLAVTSDGAYAQCHVCGEWFVSVASHANGAHGIPADNYRRAFGLAQATPLVAPVLSGRFRAVSAPWLDRARALSDEERARRSPAELTARHRLDHQQWRIQHVIDGAYNDWHQRWNQHWEAACRRLATYVEDHGHALVPVRHRAPDGYHLGAWVVEQREQYRSGDLDRQRTRRLEALPGWAWNGREARCNRKWFTGLDALRRYLDREGHANPPQRHRENGYPLGQWVKTQRTLHHHGELHQSRRNVLEGLPGWVWDANDAAWDTGFRHLQAYVAADGHARVPLSYRSPDGYPLGQWVRWQRTLGRTNHLPVDRTDRLEALPGWQWRLR